jgi:hypothetical protein
VVSETPVLGSGTVAVRPERLGVQDSLEMAKSLEALRRVQSDERVVPAQARLRAAVLRAQLDVPDARGSARSQAVGPVDNRSEA